ncbi:MAG: hypothetical protein KDD61_08215 [Bdellovibrionales bacterium]|nr:hypothetical protein [Bdellovibrionales bacterium]
MKRHVILILGLILFILGYARSKEFSSSSIKHKFVSSETEKKSKKDEMHFAMLKFVETERDFLKKEDIRSFLNPIYFQMNSEAETAGYDYVMDDFESERSAFQSFISEINDSTLLYVNEDSASRLLQIEESMLLEGEFGDHF